MATTSSQLKPGRNPNVATEKVVREGRSKGWMQRVYDLKQQFNMPIHWKPAIDVSFEIFRYASKFKPLLSPRVNGLIIPRAALEKLPEI
jgi:hypothetical protein